MKLPTFQIHRPSTLEEASDLLAEHGDDAAAYCGGTELLLLMKLGLATYAHLIDVKRIDALRGITADRDALRIGAAVTHYRLERSPDVRAHVPALAEMISGIANVRVRVVGSLGGNLCFADPHSDPATFLTAAAATLVCQRGSTVREIPVAGFFSGSYQTLLGPGELLREVVIPALPSGAAIAHQRMKLRERPLATVAVMLRLAEGSIAAARVAIGSVGAVPVLLGRAAEILVGADGGDLAARSDAVADAAAEAIDPPSDLDGSADYKRHITQLLLRRAVLSAFELAARRA